MTVSPFTPRFVSTADAIKKVLSEEFPTLIVRRSWRGDTDLNDEEETNTVITVMPELCAFDPTRSRESLWQNARYLIAVTKQLSAETVGTTPLGEGWNAQIDEPAAVLEKVIALFSGGRLVTAGVPYGNLDITLVSGDNDQTFCDIDELIEHQKFLGIVVVHARWEVPRPAAAGSA